jgi:hypothetical protein
MKTNAFYYYGRPPADLINIKKRFWTDIGGSAGVPTSELLFPFNRFRVFSFAAESRGYATGQMGDTGGRFDINQSIDLNGPSFQFGAAHKGHSAQFRSTIQKRWEYWSKALDDMRTQTT